MRLTLSLRDGLVVVVPAGFDQRLLPDLLKQKQHWLERTWARLKSSSKTAQPKAGGALPTFLNLRAIGEEWSVEYQAPAPRSVTAREKAGRILALSGKTGDRQACLAALRRWLMRKARQHLEPWLLRLARESGFECRRVLVKSQRTRWGSCSAAKTISLNLKLLFVPPELARYALLHELCHTIHLNHSPRFWALLERHEPHCRVTAKELRSGWRYVPPGLDERSKRRRAR